MTVETRAQATVPEGRSGSFPRPVPKRWTRDSAKLSVAITFLVAMGTALGGAALGVFADYQDEAKAGRLSLLVVYALVAVACFVAALCSWRRRRTILQDRGTAYLVIERGEGWDVVETREYEEKLRNDFAQVLIVPSGSDLGHPRLWPRTTAQAGQWAADCTRVATSLIAVRYNDDHRTSDALFLWTDGVVAAALGKELSRLLRDGRIGVRQRPSLTGFGGVTEQVPWTKPSHTFRDAVVVTAASFRVTEPVHRPIPLDGTTESGPETVILLARCTGSPHAWAGVLPRSTKVAVTQRLRVVNGSGLTLGSSAVVREIHIEPAGAPPAADPTGKGAASRQRNHEWAAYPQLAETVATFWRDETTAIRAESPGAVVLLAAEVPMEVNYGLGVRAHYQPLGNGPLCFYDPKHKALIVTDVRL